MTNPTLKQAEYSEFLIIVANGDCSEDSEYSVVC